MSKNPELAKKDPGLVVDLYHQVPSTKFLSEKFLGPTTKEERGVLSKSLFSPENAWSDKAFEQEVLNQYTSAGIPTIGSQDFLKKYKIKPANRRNPKDVARFFKEVQFAAKKEYPKGFMIKPNEGFSASSGNFPTEEHDLPKLYESWLPRIKDFENELGEEQNGEIGVFKKYRKSPEFAGHALHEMLSGNALPGIGVRFFGIL